MHPVATLRRIADNRLTEEGGHYVCTPSDRALAAGVLAEREYAHEIAHQRERCATLRTFGWWLVVVLVAVLVTCCARPRSSSPAAFDVAEEKAAAVELRVRCVAMFNLATTEDDGTVKLTRAGEDVEMPRGSGVLVSPNQLLTAEHVADLSTIPPFLGACALYAYFPSGRRYQLTQEYGSKLYDVARMRASVGGFYEFDRAPATAAPPAPGEDVCLLPAFPMRLRRCGEVQYTNVPPPGDVLHLAITEPGNSGGGAYDRRGRLVGIVTHSWRCVNGQICGGKVAPLRPEFLQ